MKLTNSVRLLFVPGSPYNLDKKATSWNITSIDQFGLKIKLFFKNPVYIAREELFDILKISFHNTEFYLIPEDESKSITPNGYTTISELPLQSDESLPTMDLSNLSTFVLSVFLIQYVLGFTKSKLFGMIKNLQISTHLALFNVPFTANTWVIFKLLLTCVTYDFLPIHEIIPFDFSRTEPWNDRFELLGYESSNFIEALGSISLYIFANFILCGVSLLFHFK